MQKLRGRDLINVKVKSRMDLPNGIYVYLPNDGDTVTMAIISTGDKIEHCRISETYFGEGHSPLSIRALYGEKLKEGKMFRCENYAEAMILIGDFFKKKGN